MAARLRRLTLAVFGLAAAAGLALVVFVAQTGYPVLSVAPLPLPGPELTAPSDRIALDETDAGQVVLGSGLPGSLESRIAAAPALVAAAAASEGTLALLETGSSAQPQLHAQPDLGSNPGQGKVEQAPPNEVTAVTPAAQPANPPAVVTPEAPVEGSSASSGLFVRNSVAPGLGEKGEVGGRDPLPEEPEIPYEPEPTTEPEPPVEPEQPEPEPPVEPEPEPEPPAEAEPPAEPPAEAAPEEAPVEEPAPEAPAPEAPAG